MCHCIATIWFFFHSRVFTPSVPHMRESQIVPHTTVMTGSRGWCYKSRGNLSEPVALPSLVSRNSSWPGFIYVRTPLNSIRTVICDCELRTDSAQVVSCHLSLFGPLFRFQASMVNSAAFKWDPRTFKKSIKFFFIFYL